MYCILIYIHYVCIYIYIYIYIIYIYIYRAYNYTVCLAAVHVCGIFVVLIMTVYVSGV